MSEVTSFVENLPAYVSANKDKLVAKTVLGVSTLKTINIQDGVKGSTCLNTLDVDIKLQNGAVCGFEANSQANLSQRVINAVPMKVQLQFCPEQLYSKYASELIRIAAGEEVLPFEEIVTNEIVKKTQGEIDKAIWVSLSDASDSDYDANYGLIDGFATIIAGEPDVIPCQYAVGDTSIVKVQKVITTLPAEIQDAEDLVVFCSPEFFQEYLFALVNANLFNYNPKDAKIDSVVVPGSNAVLTKIGGLRSTDDTVYAGRAANFVFGTDIISDSESYKFWYSDDSQMFKFNSKFMVGVQIAFPDQIVKGSK